MRLVEPWNGVQSDGESLFLKIFKTQLDMALQLALLGAAGGTRHPHVSLLTQLSTVPWSFSSWLHVILHWHVFPCPLQRCASQDIVSWCSASLRYGICFCQMVTQMVLSIPVSSLCSNSPSLATRYCQSFAVGKGNAFFPVNWMLCRSPVRPRHGKAGILFVICWSSSLPCSK